MKNFNKLFFSLMLMGFMFFYVQSTYAQKQEKIWHWTTSMGSSGWDYINSMSTDSEGNLYLGGAYASKFSIGKKEFESKGNQDLFVAKYNTKGKLMWVWSGGGLKSDKITSLFINKGNEVIISGLVTGEAKIDKFEVKGDGKKMVLAKLNSRGRLLWFKSFPVDAAASMYFLIQSDSSEILAAGTFRKTLIIDGKKVSSAGHEDIFIASFTEEGVVKDLKSYGGKGKDIITSLKKDKNEKIYFSGTYDDGFNLGNKSLATAEQKSNNAFIANLSKNEISWVKTIRGSHFVEVTSVVPADGGNSFIAGNFDVKMNFDSISLESNGGTDFFVAKINDSGQVLWAKNYGTPYSDYVQTAVGNPAGGAMLSGSFNDSLILGETTLAAFEGKSSAFISQINTSGDIFWAKSISGEANVNANHTTLDVFGNIFISGSFSSAIYSPNTKISSIGNEDIFVAKYFNCPNYNNVILGNNYVCVGGETELKISGDFENIIWNNGLFTVKKITVNNPGAYFAEMTDKNACLLRDTIYVKLLQPTSFTLGNDTMLFTDQSITLKGPEGLHEYLWFNNFSLPQQEISAAGNYYHSQDVWLRVTNNSGCDFTDSLVISFRPKSPMIEINQAKGLKVYPNPASDYLHWSIDCDKEVSLMVHITNVEGIKVYTAKVYNYLPNQEQSIDIENLSPGIYFLNIGNEMDQISRMVIKQ